METTGGNPVFPLLLLAHGNLAGFFAYETAGSLAPYLTRELGFTSQQIGWMYSGYSIPVFFTQFASMYLQKKLGSTRCTAISTTLVCLGTLLMAVAPGFRTMMLGMILYGSGSSPNYGIVNVIVGHWFGEGEAATSKVTFTSSIMAAWWRLGSFAAFMTLPVVAESFGFRAALWFQFLVTASCNLSEYLFFFLDLKNDYLRQHQLRKSDVKMNEIGEVKPKKLQKARLIENDEIANTEAQTVSEESDDADAEVKSHPVSFAVSEDVEAVIPGDESFSVETETVNRDDDLYGRNPFLAGVMRFYRDIREFSLMYWLVVLVAALFTADLYSATAFLTKFLNEDYGYDDKKASMVTSAVCLGNVITAPLFGWIISKTGCRAKAVIFGAVMMITIHGLFTFTQAVPPLLLALCLGFTQSIMDTSLMPSLMMLVKKENLSTAFSVCIICYNIGLFVTPTCLGFARDQTGSWAVVNFCFMLYGVASLVIAVFVKVLDGKYGNVMDRPLPKIKGLKVRVGGH